MVGSRNHEWTTATFFAMSAAGVIITRMISRRALVSVIILTLSNALLAQAPQPAQQYNVLFFPLHDLKPLTGAYGGPSITPNLVRLSARGIRFNRAYCQQAVCSPSRASLMTGRRPDATKVFDLETHFRKALPDVVTLSQHFKDNGYTALSVGKIYHPGYDDFPSWSAP